MDSNFGIIGDQQITDLPQVDNSQQDLAQVEVRGKAKYSRSKEFQELKAHMETRIEFYQKFLPDGRPVATIDQEEAAKHWPHANIIIAELQQVIDMYQSAEGQLQDIGKKNV